MMGDISRRFFPLPLVGEGGLRVSEGRVRDIWVLLFYTLRQIFTPMPSTPNPSFSNEKPTLSRKREREKPMPALIMVFSFFLTTSAFAVEPSEIMNNPAQEQRARALSSQLRCLVCQNQSIDDSNADLAKDLRVLVRQRIEAGDDDTEVRAYLVARYGEFILLKPSFTPKNFLLWTVPFMGLGMGGFMVLRRRMPKHEEALNEAEQNALKNVLEQR